jgi:hypothetical protein
MLIYNRKEMGPWRERVVPTIGSRVSGVLPVVSPGIGLVSVVYNVYNLISAYVGFLRDVA